MKAQHMKKIVKKTKNHVIDMATSMAHGWRYTQNNMLTIHSALSVVSGLGSMPTGGIVVI